MKKALFKLFVCWLVLAVILSGYCILAETTTEEGCQNVKMIKAKTLPEWEWQKTATFPDWKGYTDDTLAMNSMI